MTNAQTLQLHHAKLVGKDGGLLDLQLSDGSYVELDLYDEEEALKAAVEWLEREERKAA